MADSTKDEHWIETYKSLITLSIEAVKFSTLANGGAAVAILAYLGNVASKRTIGSPPLPDMRQSMGAFLIGLTCCGACVLFAYLTQLILLNERRQLETLGLSHKKTLWTGIAFYVLSLLFFSYGAWAAVVEFK